MGTGGAGACSAHEKNLEADMGKTVMVALAVLLLAWWAWKLRGPGSQPGMTESFPVQFSDEEWKARLPDSAYRILRHESTERAGTSPLNHEKRQGEFRCAGCDNVLFLSTDKFDSGTGWPSFVRPADPQCVGGKTDYRLIAPRTEVHCARCGGHLGHVFGDGPPPTGKRYCINGGALLFKPSEETLSQ